MKKIKYLPGDKSLKAPFIAYVDLECIIKKCNIVKLILKILSKHKPSGYAWCSICSFDDTKNKRYFYRGKDCTEKLCKHLQEFGKEIINFEKKGRKPLTNKEIKSYEKQKVCYICEKKFCDDKNKKKVNRTFIIK